ncbi:MAG: oxidoreductase coenzyme F420-dependent [Marmoricola sp.]|nr:oxidoreductase coenzyme F420-dependent [Marmoricola sp.]
MIISILGTGRVASAIGHGLVKAGHELVFGSRSGHASGLPGRVTSLAEAASVGEVIVNATPGVSALETLKAIGSGPLGAKVLIDVSNAISDGFVLAYPNASVASAIQDEFPAVSVVKTLNTVHAQVMAAPGSLASPSLVFLSGNSPDGKATVSELLADLGWSPDAQVDLGDISTARATEHYIFFSSALTQAIGSTQWNLAVVE